MSLLLCLSQVFRADLTPKVGLLLESKRCSLLKSVVVQTCATIEVIDS